MKRFYISAVLLLGIFLTGCTTGPTKEPMLEPAVEKKEEIIVKNSDDAFKKLMQGNEDYIEGYVDMIDTSLSRRKDTAKNGQTPYAVVLGCSDSRAPIEHILGGGVGDIFTVRNAGNVVTDVVSGSVAYGVKYLEAPAILVLGHTGCGAVSAAAQGEVYGSISSITDKIKNVIGDETDISEIEKLNVLNSVEELKKDPKIADLINQGKLEVRGGIYDLESGEIEYLN